MFEDNPPEPRAITILKWMRENGYEWTKCRRSNKADYKLFRMTGEVIKFVWVGQSFKSMLDFVEASYMPKL